MELHARVLGNWEVLGAYLEAEGHEPTRAVPPSSRREFHVVQLPLLLIRSDVGPFGMQRKEIFNSTMNDFARVEPHLFTGQEKEEDLGLYYYGARYYFPEGGRFLQRDPAEEFWNPYAYVGNNPISMIDETGEFGDYYTREGEWLGSDGIDDDKAFLTIRFVWTETWGAFWDAARMDKTTNSILSDAEISIGLASVIRDIKSDGETVSLGSNERLEDIAATTFGESSTDNVMEEMAGIASVYLRRQRMGNYEGALARTDGNIRFRLFSEADPWDRGNGMKKAVRAAINALTDGPDYSGGGFWWDGADFGVDPDHRVKRQGFIYGHKSHNIFGVSEVRLSPPVVLYWKLANGKKGSVRGTYDYVYESTATQGRTIFWRLGKDFMRATGNKQGK